MGRTNPKLIPFLRDAQMHQLFPNLVWEDEITFCIEFVRYDKKKPKSIYCMHEKILKAWYKCNNAEHKYISYSNARSVILAALKKSIYLIELPSSIKNVKRYKFATAEETKEKKRQQKEKEKKRHENLPDLKYELSSVASSDDTSFDEPDMQNESDAISDPPSVASSGYYSGNESEKENELDAMCDLPSAASSNNFSNDELNERNLKVHEFKKNIEDILKYYENLNFPTDLDPSIFDENFDFLDMAALDETDSSQMQLDPPDLNVPDEQSNYYWLLSKKLDVSSLLLLIFEKKFFGNEEGMLPGSFCYPNGTFEPTMYNLIKDLIINEQLFLFLKKT